MNRLIEALHIYDEHRSVEFPSSPDQACLFANGLSVGA